jgi:hypothetical protein
MVNFTKQLPHVAPRCIVVECLVLSEPYVSGE